MIDHSIVLLIVNFRKEVINYMYLVPVSGGDSCRFTFSFLNKLHHNKNIEWLGEPSSGNFGTQKPLDGAVNNDFSWV